ncbi:MFS transporter [Amycolatopsis rubida]|uniref:Predicted arabinose efflux permease, MFS family n=1 Tax=Amycolatopsis rubida TaxID=112413 RepID=A0A1I5N5D2_9PSEU|nr:MFS transporter [Amycolatopsis rubida]SFP16900.1 Predicted arabinose efflux permease, MFS family [Amycolatopsis rubida]
MSSPRVPSAVYVLAAGIFAMVTSEFAVAGLMPQLAAGLGVDVARIGYLITVFAVAMAVGGPVLTLALLRIRPKAALMVVFAVFLAGNVLAALATTYSVLVVARVISGVASQAFFGIAISLCGQLVDERVRGRAIGVAMNGLMLGTLLGLPLATFAGGHYGWRAAFWTITLLTVLAALLTQFQVRDPGQAERREADFSVFRRPKLLLALVSSTLIIGATFSAFSFFTPILTEVSGFSPDTVPVLLLGYGAATVVGNSIVGRLADRHTVPALVAGTLLNAVFLTGFALFTDLPAAALAFMLAIGLAGVTMNPAMAVRVQRAGNTSPLVNTVHSSFITLGVMIGSFAGACLIEPYGLRAPIVLGAAMAVAAVVTILPAFGRRAAQPAVEVCCASTAG